MHQLVSLKVCVISVREVNRTFPQISLLAWDDVYFGDFQVMGFPLVNMKIFENKNDCVYYMIGNFISWPVASHQHR